MVKQNYLTLEEARLLYNWLSKTSIPKGEYQLARAAMTKLNHYVEGGSTDEAKGGKPK